MKGLVVALLATLLSWETVAHAQVEIQATISSQRVEVGQELQVQITAQGGSDSPDSPRLPAPATFLVRGPSVSTQWSVGFNNGRMSRTVGLTATWLLVPQKTGKFVLGPASVTLDGNQYQSKTISVEVVPQGSLPQQPPRGRRSPFGGGIDPFGVDPFPNFPNLDDLLQQQDPSLPEYPKELEIPAALDPIAFLRATIEPQRVYIGQQVTLRVYSYGGRGPYNQASAREPAHTDFFARPLVDGGVDVALSRVQLGDRIWFAAKLREIALFPLRTGQLQIGPMEFGFGGGRYPANTVNNALLRKSQVLNVEVVEPPLEGRPAGYQLGDVGSFELGATVEPRQVEAGGAVSVVVTLQGMGNLPHALKTPIRNGIDFLAPATSEKIELREGKLGGTRTFSYVVRVSEPGTIDLGVISLPYFDPDGQRYHVASANLGTVVVRPSTAAPATEPLGDTKGLGQLTQTLKPRTDLALSVKQREYLADGNVFWGALLLGPLSVLSLTGLFRLGRSARTRLATRRHSSSAQLQLDLKAADEAARAERMADAAAAIERALYRAIETATLLKARGVLRQDLARTLASHGLEQSLCQEVVAALEQCDLLRFGEQNPARATELAEQARLLTKKLTSRRTRLESPDDRAQDGGAVS